MGMWQSVKNALVPNRSLEEELRQQRDEWKQRANEYEQKFFDLLETKERLENEKRELENRVSDLEDKVDEQARSLVGAEASPSESSVGSELRPRERELYNAVRNNAGRLESKEDVLQLVRDKLGVEWKESTLDVYLSRIKSKGVGDLRAFYGQD